MPRNLGIGRSAEHDVALRIKLTFGSRNIIAKPIRPHMFLGDRIAVAENAKPSWFRHDKKQTH